MAASAELTERLGKWSNDLYPSRRWLIFTRETALILAAALLYSLVRGLTSDRVELAFQHAEQVISFQRSVGIFIEPQLQRTILGHTSVVDAANTLYIWGYWPVLVGTLVW